MSPDAPTVAVSEEPEWIPGKSVFVCGTRAVLASASPGVFRVVCATCGAGGTVLFDNGQQARSACIRTSNHPCRECGAM